MLPFWAILSPHGGMIACHFAFSEPSAGCVMSHEWIFDVLADLKSYADQNGLQQVSEKTGELLAVARAEITDRALREGDDTPSNRMN